MRQRALCQSHRQPVYHQSSLLLTTQEAQQFLLKQRDPTVCLRPEEQPLTWPISCRIIKAVPIMSTDV